MAAQVLKERMQPIREKFPEADWKELCLKSEANKIDLIARCLYVSKSPQLENYLSNPLVYVDILRKFDHSRETCLYQIKLDCLNA